MCASNAIRIYCQASAPASRIASHTCGTSHPPSSSISTQAACGRFTPRWCRAPGKIAVCWWVPPPKCCWDVQVCTRRTWNKLMHASNGNTASILYVESGRHRACCNPYCQAVSRSRGGQAKRFKTKGRALSFSKGQRYEPCEHQAGRTDWEGVLQEYARKRGKSPKFSLPDGGCICDACYDDAGAVVDLSDYRVGGSPGPSYRAPSTSLKRHCDREPCTPTKKSKVECSTPPARLLMCMKLFKTHLPCVQYSSSRTVEGVIPWVCAAQWSIILCTGVLPCLNVLLALQ